jgi:hypothetical protein
VGKRSLGAPQLAARDWGNDHDDDDDTYLKVGDKPWYCFWNSTISEFWVFLAQDMNDDDPLNGTSTITPAASIPTTIPPGNVYTSGPDYYGGSTMLNPSATSPGMSEPTNEAYWPTGSKRKRQTGLGSPDFPKLAKMVEKRKPDNNVQPYCQQMQVLNNWQIMPIPDIPTICVEESDFSAAATPTAGSRRAVMRRDDSTIQQLNSNCICEWFSI